VFIIVTEPLPRDYVFNSKELDRDNIVWFEVPVLRANRYDEPEDKKIIVRLIPDSEFFKTFKVADHKVRRRYIAESLLINKYINERDTGGGSGYLNA